MKNIRLYFAVAAAMLFLGSNTALAQSTTQPEKKGWSRNNRFFSVQPLIASRQVTASLLQLRERLGLAKHVDKSSPKTRRSQPKRHTYRLGLRLSQV